MSPTKRKKKTRKNPIQHVRLPLPAQTGGKHKDKKQYTRKGNPEWESLREPEPTW